MKQPSQTSTRRQEASRRNGSLSKGLTPKGKARSSRNATVHGCLATMITFGDGEAEVFNAILAEYTARFEPRDHDLVEEIVHAKWQMRQAWMYENSMLGLQMVQDAEAVDVNGASSANRTAAPSPPAANLQRYTRSLALQPERGMKLLLELRSHRLPPNPSNETNLVPFPNTSPPIHNYVLNVPAARILARDADTAPSPATLKMAA